MNDVNGATMQTTMTLSPRRRRGKKRLVFQPPRTGPSSVRALWENASPEEKARAHKTSVAVLAMWLGRRSRQEVAEELSLPPLRVWQLSQSALAGMLAGLLKQPRGRGKGLTMESKEEDPRALRKRISELEMENRALKELLEVLKNLPSAREQPAPRPTKPKAKKKHGAKNEIPRGGEERSGPSTRDEEAPSR